MWHIRAGLSRCNQALNPLQPTIYQDIDLGGVAEPLTPPIFRSRPINAQNLDFPASVCTCLPIREELRTCSQSHIRHRNSMKEEVDQSESSEDNGGLVFISGTNGVKW